MKKILIFLFTLSLAIAENPTQEFTNANNLFAQSAYKQISQNQEGNFLVSPFSAETILAFAHSGCKGESAEELGKALHLPEDKSKIETSIKTLLSKFKSNDLYTLLTANKVYLEKNFNVRSEFKNVGNSIYGADTEKIDFVPDRAQAGKTINNWVEQQTNNKIKNLVDYNDFDNFTRAILINALYFKANWSNPFLLAGTLKEKFYKNVNEVIEVDTLHHFEEHFNYYECPHLKAKFLELPFKGDEASMVIVLPNAKDGLPSLENQLDKVFEPSHQLKWEYLNVALPKFKIESSIDFKGLLEKLGVKKIFQEKKADLSGIAGDPGDLYIKKVAQKTLIDVNEEGVEAAAATYVLVAVPQSARLERPKDFIADHPFIFYIKVRDVVIFAGRVTDPSKS